MAMPNIETKNMTSGVQINLQSDLLNSIEHHGTGIFDLIINCINILIPK